MKKICTVTLLVSVGLNVIIPLLIYIAFGFRYEYTDVKVKYVYFASIILIFVLLADIILIKRSRKGESIFTQDDLYKSKYLNTKAVDHLFFISLVISSANVILVGGFSSTLAGNGNGTFLAYIQMLFDIRILYFFVLLKAYKARKINKIVLYSILYVLVSVMNASRAGIFWAVFFNTAILFSTNISRRFKQSILALAILGAMVAPLLFAYSTNKRADESFSIDYIAHKIVARIAYNEVAGIELEQYLEGKYRKDVFDEKYSLKNQFEQSINAIVPGEVFENDVQPNQYWRTVFCGWTIDGAYQNYMSMYSILPMYFILKYGIVSGIIGAIIVIYVMYRILCRIKDAAVASFFGSVFLYTVFQFFDWTYHFQDLLSFILTLIMISLYGKVIRRIRIGESVFYE